MTGFGVIVLVLASMLAIPLGIVAIVYLILPVMKFVAFLVKQVLAFVLGEIGDSLRLVGAVVTSVVLLPLILGSVIVGRWSASAHYGRALTAELKAGGRAVYRIALGHPARLLCLTPVVEGIEQRIPEAVAAAPGADRPGGRAGQVEGYVIVGSLPGGGSGGRLYIAEPNGAKRAALARQGYGDVDRVVIKTFSLRDGSTLPQIVRENRALDAAKRLGLILEHDLTPERFHYVMRYVPGESLTLVTQRLHAGCGDSGLSRREVGEVLDYSCDLLRTLCHYHAGGLWHKDVKPDNIIVSQGQAHLVDFGLVTPLRSAMTLTTHGTEYFRDPEMVRMALRGVKVHEVDGAKFDVYAAGAVLYSMIENSFPAHGGLSQITRACPEAVRWIVRRAMTDYDKRYETAGAMLADVDAVASAPDPFAVKIAALPSVRETEAGESGAEPAVGVGAGFAGAGGAGGVVGAGVGDVGDGVRRNGSPVPPGARTPAEQIAAAAATIGAASVQMAQDAMRSVGIGGRGQAVASAPGAGERVRPRLRVKSWWTGRYEVEDGGVAVAAARAAEPVHAAPVNASFQRRATGRSAKEQLDRARARAAAARERIRARIGARASSAGFPASGVNTGVVLAALLLIGVVVVLVGFTMFSVRQIDRNEVGAVAGPWTRVDGSTATVRGSKGRGVVSTSPSGRDHSVSATANWAARSVTVDESSKARAERGIVVVLRDASALDPEVWSHAEQQFGRLHESGFRLWGGPAKTSDGADTAELARQDAVVADLRTALRLSPFESPDAREAIRAWLAEHRDVALVAWVTKGDDGQPAWWMVAPGDDGASVLRAASSAVAGTR